jgi:hypothetical protein
VRSLERVPGFTDRIGFTDEWTTALTFGKAIVGLRQSATLQQPSAARNFGVRRCMTFVVMKLLGGIAKFREGIRRGIEAPQLR